MTGGLVKTSVSDPSGKGRLGGRDRRRGDFHGSFFLKPSSSKKLPFFGNEFYLPAGTPTARLRKMEATTVRYFISGGGIIAWGVSRIQKQTRP